MSDIRIYTMALGSLMTNCYIIANGNEAVVVDPAASSDLIIKKLSDEKLTLSAILLTHGHYDHIGAANNLREKYGVKVYMHKDEVAVSEDPDNNLSISFMQFPMIIEADVLLNDNEELKLAGMDIRVIHTPGHTVGSCCYYIKEAGILISGDTLFNESVGRSDFPTGSTGKLIRSIGEKLFILPEDTNVYPGHGDMTTIGYEKIHNCCVGYL